MPQQLEATRKVLQRNLQAISSLRQRMSPHSPLQLTPLPVQRSTSRTAHGRRSRPS